MSVETKKGFPTLLASSARAAGSAQVSSSIDVSRFGVANIFLEVTAVGGTPTNYTLSVKLQGSIDGGTTWYDLETFESMTALGIRVIRRPLGGFQQLRVVYTLSFTGGSSPTLTFSVRAQLDQLPAGETAIPLKGADIKAEAQYASAQTNQELVAAPGAGKRLVITEIVFSNGGTAGKFKLVEDTAGTPAVVKKEFFFPANGGLIHKPTKPIKLTANKNLGITSTTVTDHSIEVYGYTEILA